MLKVIVLSGFLGSGKTTLVKNILTNAQNKKVAVILNDISEIDIDTDLVKNRSLHIKKHKDIVQISNGCICCTLKEDMIKEVKKIAKSKKFQYLVIEATGVSTPLPIAQAFAYTEGIQKYAQVYSMVTVIDAEHFQQNLISNELVEDEEKQNETAKQRRRRKVKKEDMQAEDEKPTIAELMLDQLQIADLMIINKIDLVNKKQKDAVFGFIHGINPNSQIIMTSYSQIDLNQVFKKRFDLQKAEICQRWIAERNKPEDIPQTIKYNISSFIYKNRRPFDPEKFHTLITNPKYWPFWQQITRAKGFFWLANYPRFQFLMHKAGKRIVYSIEKPWYVEMPKNKWVTKKKELTNFSKFIQKYWQEPNGDKRNQIVFISKDLNQKDIRSVLDECLIPESLMLKYQESYQQIQDPFEYQWKDAIKFFEENDLLLANEGEWEEMEDEDDECIQDEEYIPSDSK